MKLRCALVLCSLPFIPVEAAVTYSTPGSFYTQDFDSLPNTPQNVTLGNTPIGWTDDNASPGASNFSIVGWYLYHPLLQTEGGSTGHQRVRIGAGTANTGSFMSWGASGSTERALGSLASNTMADPATSSSNMYFGLRLRNDTGVTLDNFTLSYNGEQWRDGGAATPNAQGVIFMWSTTATAISDPDALFAGEPSLSYTSPVFVNTGAGAAVDGNTAGRVALSSTVTGINWLAGTDLWLRWADLNNAGNDHGFGIDDLSFSANVAVPEPSSLALFSLGAVAFLSLRRKR